MTACIPDRCAIVARLAHDLGVATGRPEAAIRVRYGLGHPEAPIGRGKPVSADEKGQDR